MLGCHLNRGFVGAVDGWMDDGCFSSGCFWLQGHFGLENLLDWTSGSGVRTSLGFLPIPAPQTSRSRHECSRILQTSKGCVLVELWALCVG